MKLVDDTVEVSVKHVRAFVHQYLSARLDEARSQIEQYGGRYTDAMLHAMETSKQGAASANTPTCTSVRSMPRNQKSPYVVASPQWPSPLLREELLQR